ncbi:DNA sulfur modification protein DndB [Streptacidiphilus sp. N1-3]|uniref:DNA sulfur modification protein DndB n=1 Tax=Streptacidiphilus alkalitolerans TaxID=3342712 RepID=A0ABV6WT41_9ACTN
MSLTLTLPTPTTEGIQLTVIPFRQNAVVGTIGLTTLLQLVPSPKREEDQRAMRYADGMQRRHSEMRALVQRMLKSTQKGRNVTPYAAYIAGGVSGDFGSGWSTPPITLWLAGRPGAVSEDLVPGSGIHRITVVPGSPVVAIDGETQITAWHELYDDPERFGLTYETLGRLRVPFELYWDLSVEDARQIFYDRNVEGVAVDKNLAMSMDQRDFGTQLAHRIADSVKVEIDGKVVSFAKLVQSRKRQLAKADPELVTLSALRVLVITTVFGRGGLGLSSDTVSESDLPANVTAAQVQDRVVPQLSQLVSRLFEHFAARSAITAPAVLAGLGIAAHQATGWAGSGSALTDEELLQLLSPVCWEREARYWDGIAASATSTGALNFRGGAKDSGGRVADAILYPDTEPGRRIRGR